jgi:hypothetical protein
MNIRRFDHKTDADAIRTWLAARKLPQSLAEDLPHLGYMAECYNGDLVAAGFLRSCEGRHAIADSFITNPEESPQVRDLAMDLVLSKILETAKELKLKSLVAYSLDSYTISRAKRHGFAAQPYTVLTMNLKEVV